MIVGHGVAAEITEVEAYNGPDDPASHAYTRTPRSAMMYGPPMRLYVYQMHGHHCANVVTSPEGEGAAVLIRAGRIIDGVELARERRPGAADAVLGRGPGNLAGALGITIADKGTDLHNPDGVHLRGPLGTTDETQIAVGPRVGVRLAADNPWRFWIPGAASVSAYRRHPKAPPPE